jgi:hypothetical protein
MLDIPGLVRGFYRCTRDGRSFQTRNKFVQQEIFAAPYSFWAAVATLACEAWAAEVVAQKTGNNSVIWAFLAKNWS